MKLYEAKPKTWVKILQDEIPSTLETTTDQKVFFDHLDGMYSYCKTEQGEICHLVAWTEVEQL